MRSGRLFEPLEGGDVRLTIVDHVVSHKFSLLLTFFLEVGFNPNLS